MNLDVNPDRRSMAAAPARTAAGASSRRMPSAAATRRSRAFVAALYPLATLLVVLPAGEVLAQVWPFQPGTIRWRFGAIGLAVDNALVPLAGWTLALCVSVRLGHARTARTLCLLGVVAAAILLAACGMFGLDALQLRAGVAEGAALRGFEIVAAKALITAVLYVPALGWLAIAGWGATRTAGVRRARQREAGTRILITPDKEVDE